MAPFTDTVRLAIRNEAQGQTLVNTLWFRNLSGISEANAEQLAFDVSNWFATEVLPALQSTVTMVDVTAWDMTAEDSWVVIDTVNAGEQGGDDTNQILPLNAAMTVTFQTARRGRSYRGRNYLSGFPEPLADGIQWTIGATNVITAAYEELPAALVTSGYTHVVASQVQGGVDLLMGITTPVTGYRANRTIYKMGGRTR